MKSITLLQLVCLMVLHLALHLPLEMDLQEIRGKKGEPMTAAGKGIPLAGIHKFILRPTITGSGYGPTSRVVGYMLLKDGTIYSRPDISPHDLDLDKSRKEMPKRWGIWSATSKQINVKFKAPQQWNNYYETLPAKRGEIILGSYKTVGSFGGSRVHNFNTLILENNSRFTWRYFYRNDGDFKPHKTDKPISGVYSLDGYTIQLTYDSGQIERFLFAKFEKGKGFALGVKSFSAFSHPLLQN